MRPKVAARSPRLPGARCARTHGRGSGCRRRAPLVRLGSGGLTGPDDQDDPADDRDQRQQQPPAGAADVMQTAHEYREAGDDCRQAEDAVDGAYVLRVEQQKIGNGCDEAADNQEQDEIPVRRTRRAVFEVEVVSEPSCDRLPKSHGCLPRPPYVASTARRGFGLKDAHPAIPTSSPREAAPQAHM